MRCHLIVGAALAAWPASESAAQDGRSALCAAAHEHLTEASEISREMMQAPLAGIDTASRRATELPDEQQIGAIEVLDIIIEASLEGLEERNSRLADNQAALARTLYELCGEEWPHIAPAPPEELSAPPAESE